MPGRTITDLRKSGRLEEALALAQAEWENGVENLDIWTKRAIAWVHYDYLKKAVEVASYPDLERWLEKIIELDMPDDEGVYWENIAFQIGKAGFALAKKVDGAKISLSGFLKQLEQLRFVKPGESYSFLFKGLHKLFKENDDYIQFADWWGFDNFRDEDYESEVLDIGKRLMAVAEQAHIAYAKHLLPKRLYTGEVVFDRDKSAAFLAKLTDLSERRPDYQYPPYFQAKLLLALGEKENVLSALLPFARKKRNDFWVWEVISEAFPHDSEEVFACYCRALVCPAPEEMLVALRQKFARLLIQKQLYDQAKTEIVKIVDVKNQQGHKLPAQVVKWVSSPWYDSAKNLKSNKKFYRQYSDKADAILYHDIPEEYVFVEFVNKDKQVLNFVASETKYGFFKYDRCLTDVNIGDVLRVRFQQTEPNGKHLVLTASNTDNPEFRAQFMKEFQGIVRIREGAKFGFSNDVFIPPAIVEKYHLADGMLINATAIKSFNPDKKELGWKVVSLVVLG